MSNFLLKEPDCVLIHIPKNGGSSIRHGIWESRYDGPTFGVIPEDWQHLFKFAFVRHPLERLVSAWADFDQIRDYPTSIEAFVEIVIDETIIFDERRKKTTERVRHHTIPQTHPFNSLHEADFVGRFENYAGDLNHILSRVGKEMGELPQLRKTDHGSWREHLKGDTLQQCLDFYADDFEKLGYDI